MECLWCIGETDYHTGPLSFLSVVISILMTWRSSSKIYIHHWVKLRKNASHIPSHLLRPALHKAGAPKCATHVPFTLRPWGEKWRKKSCGKNLLPTNSLLISEFCAFHQLAVVFLPTQIPCRLYVCKNIKKNTIFELSCLSDSANAKTVFSFQV